MLRTKPHGKKTSHLKMSCDWPGCDNEFLTAKGPYEKRIKRCSVHQTATPQRTNRKAVDNQLLRMLGLI